jgi:serine/threonine protein kinase
MKSEWEIIERLFHAACELRPEDRNGFLDRECGPNAAVREKVEALLRHHEKPTEFLNEPAAEMVAGTLIAGSVLGPYQIIEVAGAGGMGQVYRARDSRLRRDVAIKALPYEFAYDSEWRSRLTREATVLASLNHPNVAAIYDVMEVNDNPYLILEFVEGTTLAETLREGPVPLEQALHLGSQIAVALEAAHAKGIAHRDLKPANIKVTLDGKLKVLDFGLAKALDRNLAERDLPPEPALANTRFDYSRMPGTPAYMSPEQVRRDPVDQRTDIWSFGCLMYELLTGRKAYQGNTVSEVFASILRDQPDWTLLPKSTPPEFQQVLRKCLEKEPDSRVQAASEITRTIRALAVKNDEREFHRTLPGQRPRVQRYWLVIAAVFIGLAVVAGLILRPREPANLSAEQTFQVTRAPEPELDPGISPDGSAVAYVLQGESRSDIYVRDVAGHEPVNLTKDLPTISHRWPRWSPDGSQIAFAAIPQNQRLVSGEATVTLYVVRFPGGTPRAVTNVAMRGHAWSPDGTKLVFGRDREIDVINTDGTGFQKLTEDIDPWGFSWSPDGKWVAFTSGNLISQFVPNTLGNIATTPIVIVAAAGGPSHRVVDASAPNTSPVWMPDSKSLLFVSNRGGARDLFQISLSDAGDSIGEPVRVTTGLNALSVDISKDGRHLAYSLFIQKANLWSMPIPETGPVSAAGAQQLTTEVQMIESMSATRDGKWIVFDSTRLGKENIFRMPRSGGTAEQLTSAAQTDSEPNVSPDGKFVTFHSMKNGNRDIYVMAIDGSGLQQVTDDPGQEYCPRWAPDNHHIVFFSDKTQRLEVYSIGLENGRWGAPRQLTSSNTSLFPQWSPDGRSIAYIDATNGVSVMDPDGKNVRHIVPMQPLDPKYVVWSSDSKTLYFKCGSYGSRFYGLYSVPASGGTPKHLVQFDGDHNSGRPEFDADGKDFFFTITQTESNIWMLVLKK